MERGIWEMGVWGRMGVRGESWVLLLVLMESLA